MKIIARTYKHNGGDGNGPIVRCTREHIRHQVCARASLAAHEMFDAIGRAKSATKKP